MKKVEAIIKLLKLEAVKEALAGAGIDEFTVSEVKSCGHQTELYRGSKHVVEFLRKLKIETLVDDYKAAQTVGVIKKAAHTGWVSDEQVVVLSVDEVIRIRTGERGSRAL
jgi:nitrogen regulatory protein P-II 1